MSDNFNKFNERQPEQQAQVDKSKEVRREKIQKLKALASKLGISLEQLSESQIDKLLEKIDQNSFQLLQKLSSGLKNIDNQAAQKLQQMIIEGDLDDALAFVEDLHKTQADALGQFDENFTQAQQQTTAQTIQAFLQNLPQETKQIAPANNYDFDILRASYNQTNQTITIYADIAKIKGYTLTGFSFTILQQGIDDILPTHSTTKDFFDNKFIIHKFTNENLLTSDFTLTILKIIGKPQPINLSDVKIRVAIDTITKEIPLSDIKVI